MSDQVERVVLPCPACAPGGGTVHEVVKPGTPATVRCTECGHVHKEALDRPVTVTLDVVISQDGESFPATVEAPAAETLAVGEEFVVDTEEAILAVRITSLELAGDRRTDRATAADVETVWTRAVDNVSVNVTIHPADGRRDRTRSETVYLPGDHEFVVGAEEAFGDERVRIEGIAVRDDAVGYPTTKLDRAGDAAPAKDVKRLYAREVGGSAWSAW